MRVGVVGGLVAALVGAIVFSAWLTESSHADDGSCAVPVAYPGDDAAQAALARWMRTALGRAGSRASCR